MSDELSAAADDLYAADLDDFMAVRKQAVAQARAAGAKDLAKQIGGLRKPTVAAWALNYVMREHGDLAGELTSLGERMRSAQAKLDAPALTALRPERDALLADVLSAADDASLTLSGSARDEVRASLIASLADAHAERAVVSGRLTRALSYAGFGEVDLDAAVALPLPPADTSPTAGGSDARPPKSAGPPSKRRPAEPTTVNPAERSRSGAKHKDNPAADSPPAAEIDAARRREQEERVAEQEAIEAEREIAAARLALAEAEQIADTAHRRAQELARLATTAAQDASKADEVTRQARARVTAARDAARQAGARRTQARKSVDDTASRR